MNSRQDLLQRLLTGEVSPDDEEVRAALLTSPELADALAEFTEISARLDEDAALEREALDSLDSSESAPGQERVAATMATLYAEQTGSGAGFPRWLAAAAVILVAGLALLQLLGDREDHGGDERGVLLGNGIQLHAPVGNVPSFESFSWTAERPRAGTLRLLLWDADAVDSEPRSFQVDGDSVWSPTHDELSAMPDRIEWQVEVRNAMNEVVATSERISAQRVP